MHTGLDAAGQMAADLALLSEVAGGAPPALRLYTWRRPALSLGRFQDDDDVDRTACARLGVEVVRRPTGGRALLHGADLTYAVAMPRPAGAGGTVDAVYRWIAHGLVAGLHELGVDAAVACHQGPSGPACFATQQGADVRVGSRKLCGSAQVHHRGAVLQHGSILCRRQAIDETDLLRLPDDANRASARARLRDVTVTLSELDAPSDPPVVASALERGFAEELCICFTAREVGARGGGSTSRRGRRVLGGPGMRR